MSTVREIKTAIAGLSPEQRAELQDWLLRQAAPSNGGAARLPNQAARRRRILGNKVLPNAVLEARDASER